MRPMRPLPLLIVAIACAPRLALGDAAPLDAFPLRNHNPFLQVYGLPAFATHELVAPGGVDFNVSFDIANDMDEADRSGEVLIIDAELRTLNLSIRRRVGERFEIGLDVPYLSYSGGFLDRVIYDFHDLLGLSNSSREVPNDQFRLYMEKNGVTLFDAVEPSSGIGDLQVSAALQLGKATLRASIKAPTGDPDKLTGSGAADLAVGLYGGGATALLERPLSYSGFVGILALGDGDILPTLQRNTVPYGGVALRWHATERFSLATQVYGQGAYFDAELKELGGDTLQLAFGGDYRFPAQRLLLRFAIAEDMRGAAAPDFAVQLSLRRYIR
jgi:hypothetical protein